MCRIYDFGLIILFYFIQYVAIIGSGYIGLEFSDIYTVINID